MTKSLEPYLQLRQLMEQKPHTPTIYMEAHFLCKIKVVYDYDEIYIDDDLSEAFVTIVINGHEHSKTSTTKRDNIYSLIENDDTPEEVTEAIGYSTMQLLFEEPKGIINYPDASIRGIKLSLQCKHPEFRPPEAGRGTCPTNHSGGLNQVFSSAVSANGGEEGLKVYSA